MKLKISYLIVPLFLIAGYFLLHTTMPKYSGQYLFLVILILGDTYLWSSLKTKVFNYTYWLRFTILFLYWLPLAMLIIMLLASNIVPLIDWSNGIRTYLMGFILVFYTAKLLPVVFLLLSDIVRVTQKLFFVAKKEKRQELVQENKDQGISRSRFLQYVGYVSGGLVLGTMLTGMFKWAYEFKIVREKLVLPNLPASFRGFKIVQISDVHLGSWSSVTPLQRAVDMINELKADVVLFTGDIVNFSTKEVRGFEDVLSQIKAKRGVYAVLGNHDYGDYVTWPSKQAKEENMQELYEFFDEVGWELLNNENRIFSHDDGSIAVTGVENWSANSRFPRKGNLKKAVKGTEDADVNILMTHDPSHWDSVVIPEDYNIDLTLSGHTHGFQFGIDTEDFKWSPAKYMYKQWAGLYENNNYPGKYLYVNRGLGSIGYPGRIGILPEITEIILT